MSPELAPADPFDALEGPASEPCPQCKGKPLGETSRAKDYDRESITKSVVVVMRTCCGHCQGTGRAPRRCPECGQVAGGIRCACDAMVARLEVLAAQSVVLQCEAPDRREIDGRCRSLARVMASTDDDAFGVAKLCTVHARKLRDQPKPPEGLHFTVIPLPEGTVEWWDSAARLGLGF